MIGYCTKFQNIPKGNNKPEQPSLYTGAQDFSKGNNKPEQPHLYAGARDFSVFAVSFLRHNKSAQHSKTPPPLRGRRELAVWRGRAKPVFKRQTRIGCLSAGRSRRSNFGTPCRNRTYNCPLGGGCYIHLTKEAG